jgi:hypothetical protein
MLDYDNDNETDNETDDDIVPRTRQRIERRYPDDQ